ncbi:flagellar biosynthesis regulator FlbT [Nitrobacteraceae bacterium AZCC 1564]
MQNGWNPLRTSKREPSSYSDKSNSKAHDTVEIAAKSGIVCISLVDFVYPLLTMFGKDRAESVEALQPIARWETEMALKVELKPHEKIIVGSCVITNTDQRAKLLIEGDKLPILREKDILTPATANTPAKLIYLAVQLMYISDDPQEHHPVYFDLMRDILIVSPGSADIIQDINNHILGGDYYKALKEARKLIAYEEQTLAALKEAAENRAA